MSDNPENYWQVDNNVEQSRVADNSLDIFLENDESENKNPDSILKKSYSYNAAKDLNEILD